MCQALSQGGRRCPIHLHTSVGTVRAATDISGLNRRQVESLFRELRREGRHGATPTSAQRLQLQADTLAACRTADDAGTARGLRTAVAAHLVNANDQDTNVDGATYYAQHRIVARAADRAERLSEAFETIAQRTGYTNQEIAAKFAATYDEVNVAYGAGVTEDEYTPTARAHAVAAGLPYDRASVVALEKLYTLPAAQAGTRERRVTHQNTAMISNIQSFGYDEGRLEIVMVDRPETTLAYQNVPEALWENLRQARRPGRIYTSRIQGNPNYMYENAEAAEADAYGIRCASCGQFRAAAHSCPEREVRAELATVLPAETVADAMTAHNAARTVELVDAVGPELAVVQAETQDETEPVDTPAAEELAAYSEALESLYERLITETDSTALEEQDPTELTEQATPAPVTNVRERREPTVVVPAPEFTAEVLQAPVPAFEASLFNGAEAFGPFKVVDPAAPAEVAFLPTSDNQAVPQRTASVTPAAYEDANMPNVGARLVVKGGENLTWQYYAAYISDENKALIATADPNMRFVFTRGTATRGIVYEPRIAYDYNHYQIRNEDKVIDGERRTVFQLIRKPIVDTPSYETLPDNTNTETRGAYIRTRIETIRAEEARFTNLVESGTAARPIINASASRRYVLDANLPQQPSIRTAPTADVRNAIRDNQVVVLPVEVNFGRYSNGDTYVDDQGYNVAFNSRNLAIEGSIAVRRNEAGAIEVISSERQLRCNCYDYRRNYYCKHISYTRRHIANVVQQMIPDTQAVGRTPATTTVEGVVGSSHRLLTAPLRRRQDIEVVAGENGQPDFLRVNYTANTTVTTFGNRVRAAYLLEAADRMPAEEYVTGELTIPQRQRLLEIDRTLQELHRVGVPERISEIRAALRRSDVEIPVRYMFYGSGESPRITGTITVAKQQEWPTPTEPIVREHNLQCTCDEYQRNHDCRHIRTMRNQAYMVLQTTGRGRLNAPERHGLYEASNRYRTALEEEQSIQSYIDRRVRFNETRSNGLAAPTREEAIAGIAREAEEAAAQQREYDERRRQERLAYEEANRARIEREAEERRQLNAANVEGNLAYRERMQKRWTEVETTYAADPGQFYTDYKDALRRKRNKETVVPFRTENVTDGICADEPGARRFGIELEFDIKPGVNRGEALRKIGQELHAAGLTRNAHQEYYHAAASSTNGYAMWSFEQDCTVDAELVSPIMKDTPEHWAQLQKALDIIKANGGTATTRTGSHVHVSTGSYETSTAKHVELLRAVNNNDDILYRMASSPERGRHRGMQWCAPNVNDDHGDVSEDTMAAHSVLGYQHQNHNVGLNFEGTMNPRFERANIEFRMWDGTLDAATIQQQVVMSAAITDYAERQVIANKGSKKNHEKRQNVGTGKQQETAALTAAGTATHTSETFAATHGHVAEFFDSIFRRKEDRANAMALFANTSWQSR